MRATGEDLMSPTSVKSATYHISRAISSNAFVTQAESIEARDLNADLRFPTPLSQEAGNLTEQAQNPYSMLADREAYLNSFLLDRVLGN